MTTFNWRVLSPNTLRVYTQSAKDFETVTGRRVDQADTESIAAWQASMEGRNLSGNTIRKRLSVVSLLSGVKVNLPKYQKPQLRPLLNAEQVHALMSIVTDPGHRLCLMQLLTLGTKARQLQIVPESFGAHFVGCTSSTLNAQQATRMIKRYAGRAGLDASQVSLRVWCVSGRRLLDSLGVIEFLKVVETPDVHQGVDWKPLHGIGRRSKHAII